MASYRVKPGKRLGHHGQVCVAGAVVELSEAVGTDTAVAELVELVVDEVVAPPVVSAPPVDAVTSPVVTNAPPDPVAPVETTSPRTASVRTEGDR